MARRYRMINNVICCIFLLDYALGTIAITSLRRSTMHKFSTFFNATCLCDATSADNKME